MSELRVDNIVDMGGSGAPQLRKGANVTGISTITQAVVGNATINAGGINIAGVVTSTSNKFVGDFASGNITAGVMTATSSVVASSVTLNAGGINIGSGIVSATSYQGSGANLTGIGLSIAPLIYSPEIGATEQAIKPTIELSVNQRIKVGVGSVSLRMVSAGSTVAETFGLGISTSATYAVTVSNPGSGNKYYFDGNLSYQPTLYPGGTYTFDQSNASNSSHPLRFATAADAAGSTQYTTGVETNGTPGNSGAYTRITVAADAPTPLYYYCTNHSGMGSYVNIGNNVSIDNSGTLPKLSFTPVNDLALDSVIFVDIPDGSITKMDGTSLSPTSWTFTTDNIFYYWGTGSNTYGQLAQNNRTSYSSPVQIGATKWSALSSSNGRLGSQSNGTLWSWGYNTSGKLGHNNRHPVGNLSSPVQIPGTTWSKNITMAVSISCAVKTDGTLWAWGANGSGQLGINNRTSYSSPVQVPGTTWATGKEQSTGYAVTHCMKTDGTLWCIGGYDGEYGTKGIGDISPSGRYNSSPVQIPGTTWSTINGGYYHVSALKTDGTLWLWGNNYKGGLGQNDTNKRSSPIQVPGTWSSATTSTAGNSSAGIKPDGTLWSWGYNYQGSLGHNNDINYSSPVQIPGTTWSMVRQSGQNAFAATKTDGTLWVWGQNNPQGVLGQNQAGTAFPSYGGSLSSPTQIPGTTWQVVLDSGEGLIAGKS